MRNQQQRRGIGVYAALTGILLVCAGPIGLVALWLGPWSLRSKVVISCIWLVIFGPALYYYATHGMGL